VLCTPDEELNTLIFRFLKFARLACHWSHVRALTKGVAAAIEHEAVLGSLSCKTVVDIGANKGQFALAVRKCSPTARIISFEPLAEPAEKYRSVFLGDNLVVLHEVAIGEQSGQQTIHLSRREDSSSLLPITSRQNSLFPGTDEVGSAEIRVAPLNEYLDSERIECPAILKIDVQGYELQVLRGCEDLIRKFDFVYVECSFVELYSGQALANEVVDWLHARGLLLTGVYNLSYAPSGLAVQGDFLFSRHAGE